MVWFLNSPANSRVKMMTSWYTAWPRMFFIMVLEMSGLLRPYGLRKSRDSVGGSVARARDARVSMMRFTQSIWTAFRGESCRRRGRVYLSGSNDNLPDN